MLVHGATKSQAWLSNLTTTATIDWMFVVNLETETWSFSDSPPQKEYPPVILHQQPAGKPQDVWSSKWKKAASFPFTEPWEGTGLLSESFTQILRSFPSLDAAAAPGPGFTRKYPNATAPRYTNNCLALCALPHSQNEVIIYVSWWSSEVVLDVKVPSPVRLPKRVPIPNSCKCPPA